MILADFEPGLLFLLLWGLISWLTRKKKKNIPDKEEVGTKPALDIVSRLQKLQEHLSQEVDIFPTAPPPLDAEEEYFAEEDKHGFEEPEILEPKSEDVHEAEGYAFETAIKVPTTVYDNWLKQNLFQKSNLRKLMVIKEVLGEPRSLKPYTGDYFDS